MPPPPGSMLPSTRPLVSAMAPSMVWMRAPHPWACRRSQAAITRSIAAAAAVAERLVESAASVPPSPTQTVFSSRAKISDHCLPWLRNARTRSNKDKNFESELLYENDYCSVHLARHRTNPQEHFIIKRFDKAWLATRPDLQAKVKLEWDIHCSLHHAHIVQAYLALEDAGRVEIYMEYAGDTDAYAYLNAKQRLALREADARQLVADVLAALSYCHSLGIVHRDVKSENVFRTSQGVWKLGDFGSALRLGSERALSKQPLKLEGTFSFAAPEYVAIWRGFSRRQLLDATSFKLDSWSVGALAYDVLCGRAPFALHDGIDRATEGAAIQNTDPAYPCGLSYDAVSFMKQALEKDPQKRPTVQQLALHPWFEGLPGRQGGGVVVMGAGGGGSSSGGSVVGKSGSRGSGGGSSRQRSGSSS